MSHTTRRQAQLLARIRRIGGQIAAVERALEAKAACGDILQLLASIRGATAGLTAEIMEDHLREHILAAPSEKARAEAVTELGEAIRTYVR